MRILLLADEPSKSLWDYYDETKLKGYDLILSAGDLPAEYLSFIVTFSNCPVLYVYGNHDERYETRPPEGCICIENKIYNYDGIRILGLGGSMRYRPSQSNRTQFTERQMKRRVRQMGLSLLVNKGFDILLTHAPARGIGDQEDLCHQGFQAFLPLLDKYHPRYMVHGHVHLNYDRGIARELTYGSTRIINASEKYTIEL